MENYDEILANEANGKIYCGCVFEFKDELKKLGFKWDSINKLWWIEKDKFTKDIFNKSMKVRFLNKTTIGDIKYYFTFYKTKNELKDLKENDLHKIKQITSKKLF